ncbi:MAG: hypothetical protein LBT04_03270 [Prevotellaceae bacterium]|jgi:tetratricopeptide (TPR) repeat protein|nr:hypothetical protein [Prevotellaceae bacterium]
MKRKTNVDNAEANVGEFISKTERFFEENQKVVYYVLLAVVLVVLVIIFGKNYYLNPKNVEASEKLVWCEQNLARDSFALALNGDGINAGFAEIVDTYSITKAKNEAAIGAAACCFHLGQYEQAIDYAGKVNKKSIVFTPVVEGLAGDCYVELKDLQQAVVHFEKAASYDNEATAPIFLKKAADIYLYELKNPGKAVELYQTIKDKYFASREAMDIDKYIDRANAEIK